MIMHGRSKRLWRLKSEIILMNLMFKWIPWHLTVYQRTSDIISNHYKRFLLPGPIYLACVTKMRYSFCYFYLNKTNKCSQHWLKQLWTLFYANSQQSTMSTFLVLSHYLKSFKNYSHWRQTQAFIQSRGNRQ